MQTEKKTKTAVTSAKTVYKRLLFCVFAPAFVGPEAPLRTVNPAVTCTVDPTPGAKFALVHVKCAPLPVNAQAPAPATVLNAPSVSCAAGKASVTSLFALLDLAETPLF